MTYKEKVNLQQRLDLFRMEDAQCKNLRDTKEKIEKSLPNALDSLYAHIRQIPKLREIFESENSIKKRAQNNMTTGLIF